MFSNNIFAFSKLDDSKKIKVLEEIKYIFYSSSSVQKFDSPEHKLLFFEKWCGDYLAFFPDEFFLYFDSSEKLLGYISGCMSSKTAMGNLRVPAFKLFSDLFEQFPAHLHINFHPEARGKGLGSVLVGYYVNHLISHHIQGLHLVTSPDAKNVSFYERLGFNQNVIRESNGHQLLFMGKYLS